MAIASAAKPGAAGRHQPTHGDRQHGEAGRGRRIDMNFAHQIAAPGGGRQLQSVILAE
jgi:hypothetical protein